MVGRPRQGLRVPASPGAHVTTGAGREADPSSRNPESYRLHCVVHRESASGIIIHDERIPGISDAAAVADARARFAHLLAGRAGSAALRDATGRMVWSTRQGLDTGPGSGTRQGPDTGPGSGTRQGPDTGPGSGTRQGPDTGPGSGTRQGPDTGAGSPVPARPPRG